MSSVSYNFLRWGALLLIVSQQALCFSTQDLLSAASSGDLDIVRAIIAENKVDVVMKFSEVPAIHAAAGNGRTEVVKALLDAGVPAIVKNFNNSGPILEAVRGDHADVVELLAKNGADLNEEILLDDVYYPLVVVAAKQGSVHVLEKLLDLHVDVDSRSRPTSGLSVKVGGDTALIGASFQGESDVIGVLLRRGANKLLQNRQGNTAIHAATFGNNPQSLKILLDSGGFNVSAVNSDGFGAVHLAAHSAAVKCLRMLMKAGASIDTEPGIDFNPLILAVRTFNIPLFKEVMSWKPDVNARDSVNYTAAYHALGNNHVDMANQLLRKGAHLGHQNEYVKGIVDEWTRFVVTCDWFYGILKSNGLSTKQISGPEPHLSYCDHIKSLGAHKSIVKLIDQADLYGYDGLVSKLSFKTFTDSLNGNFEGVKKAKERAYLDIKHLHKIDYRKKYEVDADDINEMLPNILHKFSDQVEPPRPKEEKELSLSDILGGEDTVRQVHRPPPDERPQHMRDAEAVPMSKRRSQSNGKEEL